MRIVTIWTVSVLGSFAIAVTTLAESGPFAQVMTVCLFPLGATIAAAGTEIARALREVDDDVA